MAINVNEYGREGKFVYIFRSFPRKMVDIKKNVRTSLVPVRGLDARLPYSILTRRDQVCITRKGDPALRLPTNRGRENHLLCIFGLRHEAYAAGLKVRNMETLHIIHIHGRHSPPTRLPLTTLFRRQIDSALFRRQMRYSHVMRHTATHTNTLQHATIRCNTQQYAATHVHL